jgi:hypothetical protein
MTVVEGKRDQLVGKIQERYGYEKDRAEKEVKEWEDSNKYTGNAFSIAGRLCVRHLPCTPV